MAHIVTRYLKYKNSRTEMYGWNPESMRSIKQETISKPFKDILKN